MSSFVTAAFVRRLSVSQREALIRHVPGKQQFIVKDDHQWTVRKLIELKLLAGDAPSCPRFTSLTEDGRFAAAMVLGEYADALVAAGALEARLRPIDLVELVKADRVAQRLARRPAVELDEHAG